jgi:hypothetical protein
MLVCGGVQLLLNGWDQLMSPPPVTPAPTGGGPHAVAAVIHHSGTSGHHHLSTPLELREDAGDSPEGATSGAQRELDDLECICEVRVRTEIVGPRPYT